MNLCKITLKNVSLFDFFLNEKLYDAMFTYNHSDNLRGSFQNSNILVLCYRTIIVFYLSK